MKEEMKGLYAAVVLSIAVIFATNWLFPKKQIPTEEIKQVEIVQDEQQPAVEKAETKESFLETDEALKNDRRVKIANDSLRGSLRLKGARFDDLYLTKYKQTLAADSPDVELFTPAGTKNKVRRFHQFKERFSSHFFASFSPATQTTNFRPTLRPKKKPNTLPSITAKKLSPNVIHGPKTSVPATVVTTAGSGRKVTCKN